MPDKPCATYAELVETYPDYPALMAAYPTHADMQPDTDKENDTNG